MVSLLPMSAEGFDRWWSRLWTEYRAELIAAGSTEAAAEENKKTKERLALWTPELLKAIGVTAK